jgi:hypothetical protein
MTTIRSDRRHRFEVPVDELWSALSDPSQYRRWWPWLRRLDGAAFEEGASWRCEVQPPLPYVLRFDLHLEEVEAARFATARIEGDIVGHAAIDVHPHGDAGSELRLVAALAPSSPALRAVARVAAPIARFGHDWVLDTGLRQFRRRALGEG